MTRHSRVSCSPTRRAAAATGMALTRVMTNASNRSVKPGAGPCPRHVDKAHAAVGAVDAGDARMQEGLVLEEIEVAPGFLDRVVHRAVGLAAIGAREAATGLEIDLDVEPLLLGVEVGVSHHPRRHQAECELEQIDIAHGLSPLAPFAAIVPPCSRPSRTSPHGRAIPRVLDRRSTWRRIERAAGAKGWLRRTEQKDGGKGAESPFPVLVSH